MFEKKQIKAKRLHNKKRIIDNRRKIIFRMDFFYSSLVNENIYLVQANNYYRQTVSFIVNRELRTIYDQKNKFNKQSFLLGCKNRSCRANSDKNLKIEKQKYKFSKKEKKELKSYLGYVNI